MVCNRAQVAHAETEIPPCEQPGWFPEDFGVKDHTVFWYDGYYYIAANYITGERQFAYARSPDLCNWEVMESILNERLAGTWDEMAIWSPYVFVEAGVYYLYFTGVTQEFTQSILLATSRDPADPHSWVVEDMVFQPNHPGSIWDETGWADCRDPMLMKQGEIYYLYYTGVDEQGGIVGVATAPSPTGKWTDWGNVIPPKPGYIPESPTIFYHDHFFYLFYHYSYQPETYRIGASPAGPWLAEEGFAPGWAHEVWAGQDNATYTSYLTDYSITISPLSWNLYYYPPHPFIGTEIYRSILPVLYR
jgi:beta-xylosidase